MKLLGQNLVEENSAIVVSTGDATKAYIYDKSLTTLWVSVGSDDVTVETIEIQWAAAKTFDRICARLQNWKQFTIQYDDSGWTNFSTAINETVNAATTKFYEFNSVSTTKIKISITKTMVANEEKTVAEVLAYLETIDLPDAWLPKERPNKKYKQHVHELVTGGVFMVTESTIEKYANTLTWNRSNPIDSVRLAILKTIKDSLKSFWFIPYDDEPENQYSVLWVNPYNFQMVSAWDSDGNRCYAGSIEMREE